MPSSSKVLLLDPKKCTGCLACQMACSLGQEYVCNPQRSRIRVINLKNSGRFLPVSCQHCEEAPCAAACPKSAISRDNAMVRTVVDYSLCVGCAMCVHACPFGAMGFDGDRGRPFKCDLCNGNPLCVTFCEPGALTFTEAPMLAYPSARASARRTAGPRR